MATAITLAYDGKKKTKQNKTILHGKYCFFHLWSGCWGLLKTTQGCPTAKAIYLMHRYASVQPALLSQGIQTKSNTIQAKHIPL